MNVPKYLNIPNFKNNYFLYRTAQEGESRDSVSARLIYSYVLSDNPMCLVPSLLN
jgi:hypothetical protein